MLKSIRQFGILFILLGAVSAHAQQTPKEQAVKDSIPMHQGALCGKPATLDLAMLN